MIQPPLLLLAYVFRKKNEEGIACKNPVVNLMVGPIELVLSFSLREYIMIVRDDKQFKFSKHRLLTGIK